MKHVLWFCVFFSLSAAICTASEPNALRDSIARDTTIQGYPCAKGEAWFYPDGSLNQCTLSRPAAIGGDLRAPRGAVIELWPTGAAHYLLLHHSTVLAGHRMRGATRYALAKGATTAFYNTGEIRSFFLVSNETIQGVPCHGGAWNTYTDPSGGENQVELYRDGKLQACKLSRDFSGFRAGQRITVPQVTLASGAKDAAAR